MMKNFKIKVQIKALNLAQIFEKFRQSNISVSQIKKGEDFRAEFIIYKKNLKIVKKILANFGAEILGFQHIGVSHIFQIALSRICVPIALIIAFLGVYAANFFVFRIDIRGLETLANSEVKAYLQSENIGYLTNKKAIDAAALELNLMENFPQISMVSVMIKGLTLVVNIKEKDNYNQNMQNDIVANFNGRITSINLISGTAEVAVGDIVHAGDVLVSAISGNQIVKPEANITAEVWLESTFCHFDTTYQTLRTGKRKILNNVFFMGLPIYQSTTTSPFEDFETDTSQTKLRNTILPIQIQTTTYYEVETIEIQSDFETHKQEIIEQCKKNALQQCAQGDIIKSEKSFINSTGNGCTYVSYVITAQRQI
ncbi:MAG: sporulation protein YqfD [Clostridia bacterium]|nr:sporulation protein YqfD [Clostridia bacterium]